MSTNVTMQELEAETAELLPSRETLNVCGRHSGSSNSFSYTVRRVLTHDANSCVILMMKMRGN